MLFLSKVVSLFNKIYHCSTWINTTLFTNLVKNKSNLLSSRGEKLTNYKTTELILSIHVDNFNINEMLKVKQS